jgi:hypothetical protein
MLPKALMEHDDDSRLLGDERCEDLDSVGSHVTLPYGLRTQPFAEHGAEFRDEDCVRRNGRNREVVREWDHFKLQSSQSRANIGNLTLGAVSR